MRFVNLRSWSQAAGRARRLTQQEANAMWMKPAYEDLRIGFEVTMYFANR